MCNAGGSGNGLDRGYKKDFKDYKDSKDTTNGHDSDG